jgi:lipoprotein signal peptidase
MTCCRVSNRTMFWTIVLLGFALDLGSKYAAFAAYPPGGRWEIIPGIFSIIHQERLNHGALFGFLNNHEDLDQARTANGIFMLVSAIAVVAIVFWSFRGSIAKDRWLTFALALILSGAAGNFYDRAVYGGVRDFIWFYYQPHFPVGWPVFNLADTWLVCGAGVLLLHGMRSKPEVTPALEEQAAAAG